MLLLRHCFVARRCGFPDYDRSGEEAGGTRAAGAPNGRSRRLVAPGPRAGLAARRVPTAVRDVHLTGQSPDPARLHVIAQLRGLGALFRIVAAPPPVPDLAKHSHGPMLAPRASLEPH